MKNLKKFKVSIIGILALVTAVALNMRHAFNDYGIKDNKLHVQVLAQSNGSGNGSGSGSGSSSGGDSTDNASKEGPKTTSDIECTIKGTLSHSQSTSGSNSSAWSFTGSAGTSWGVGSANLGASFGNTTDGTAGSWNYGSLNVDIKISGTRTDCQHTSTSKCSKIDPCLEALKDYRSLLN
jgi:hypothetical protein